MPAANDVAFQRATDFLAGLTNRERLAPDQARVADLRPMLDLLAALGHPGRDLTVVQVGGTKGKGTTSLLIERLAEALAIPTGTFLSPHLQRVTERIRHRGIELDPQAFASCVLAVEPAARRMPAPPSWFEAVTAAALVHFAAVRPALVILEVGMGGRLDSTSAVDHRASVITGIGLEHTEVLLA
jgi:dihydrofolate synthase/folylpolyglutamate synthase